MRTDFGEMKKSYFWGLPLWSFFLLGSTWLSGHGDKLPGLLLGIVAAYIYFILVMIRVKKSANLPPNKAVWSMRVGWVIRLVFVCFILYFSLRVPELDFLAAVVGLFSLHIVFLGAACVFVIKHKFF